MRNSIPYRMIEIGGGQGNAKFHNDSYTSFDAIADKYGFWFALRCWFSNGQPVTMFWGLSSHVTVVKRG